MTIPLLVICHTILNDAFRDYNPHGTISPSLLKQQAEAKFIIRYLMLKQGEIKDNKFISVTSEQVMKNIEEKLPNQGLGTYPAQITMLLRNLILTLNPQNITDINESIIVLSDLLSSRTEIILVTNMPKKVDMVVNYYQKYEKTSRRWKLEDIPFKIMNAQELLKILRKDEKDICDKIDKMNPALAILI